MIAKLFGFVGLFVCAVYSQSAMYAVPVKDSVPVYELGTIRAVDKPIGVIALRERLIVKGNTKEAFLVELSAVANGWVRKADVKIVRESKRIIENAVLVDGYVDLISPTLVWGTLWKEQGMVPLERSFVDLLKDNMDKETVERMAIQ